jgi:L-threonylcarbamoyladenylate synthase
MPKAKTIVLSPENPDYTQKISYIARKLTSGKVAILPTDTIYGFSASIRSDTALERISKVKGWEFNRPFVLLAGGAQAVLDSGCHPHSRLERVLHKFWPGKVTFILRGGTHLPANLLSADGKVGIRVPESAFLLELLAKTKDFLVSTSANLAEESPINNVNELKRAFERDVDLIVDMGSMEGNIHSTIVDITSPVPILVRKGAFPFSIIEKYFEEGEG